VKTIIESTFEIALFQGKH